MNEVSFHDHQMVVAGLNVQQRLLTQRSADHRTRVGELEKQLGVAESTARLADFYSVQLAIAGRYADHATSFEALDGAYPANLLCPSVAAVRLLRCACDNARIDLEATTKNVADWQVQFAKAAAVNEALSHEVQRLRNKLARRRSAGRR